MEYKYFSYSSQLVWLKTVGLIYKTIKTRLWEQERRRQASQGSLEPRNNMAVSFLDFLLCPVYPSAKEASMPEMPLGTDQKLKKNPHLSLFSLTKRQCTA